MKKNGQNCQKFQYRWQEKVCSLVIHTCRRFLSDFLFVFLIILFLFGSFGLKASLSADAIEAAGSSCLLRILTSVFLPETGEHKAEDVYRQFLLHYFQ